MNAHKVLPPGLMEAATPGNRDGVGMAYAQAAEWLRNGDTPPPELCAWLAERLEGVSVALRNKDDDRPDNAVMRALGARGGKRGRPAADDDKHDRDMHLAWEVMTRHTQDAEKKMVAIFDDVAATWPVARDEVTTATVRAAWERHGSDLIPE